MTAMEQLVRRRDAGEDLHSVVRVMKSLSAVSIKQFDAAAATLRQYEHTILLGLQAVLRQKTISETVSRTGQAVAFQIIVGSDRGLCGRFNETIAVRAKEIFENATLSGREVSFLTIGARAAERMQSLGVESAAVFSAPAAVTALSDVVESLIVHIDKQFHSTGIGKISAVYNARTNTELAVVCEDQILPVTEKWLQELKVKPWPARGLPAFTLDPDKLFSTLIQEHLFIRLLRTVTESAASEHASRLAAMQRADRHIDEFLETLGAEIRQDRQSSITQELMDIAASYGVLSARRAAEEGEAAIETALPL